MIYNGKEIFNKNELPEEAIKNLNRMVWQIRTNLGGYVEEDGKRRWDFRAGMEDCAICGESSRHMHHENYDIPEFIYFLCDSCHQRIHREERSKRNCDT